MTAQEITTNLIDVTVERIVPFGLLVRLPDARLGIIREREIAWDSWSLRQLRQRIRIGTQLHAVALGDGWDGRLELSLRLAEHDPWEQVETKYPLGKSVTGTVTGIQSYGVFIELEPGLTGLLHRSRLPIGFENIDLSEMFWRGDSVRVVVERIEPRNRHIGLNLRRALSQRWSGIAPSSIDTSLVRKDDLDDSSLVIPDESLLSSWRILIVEDDSAERATVTRWMQQSQLNYLEASSAEQALELLRKEKVDLVLSDIGLPGISGVELVEQLKLAGSAQYYALMTDWSRASNYTEKIAQLHNDGVLFLLKPLRPADLVDLLTHPFSVGSTSPEAGSVDRTTLIIPSTSNTTRLPWEKNLHRLLRQIQKGSPAHDVILFELKPGQRIVSIIEHIGKSEIAEDALLDLLHSPVRDVAEDRISCHIDDTANTETRIRYLRPLLPFRSCQGIHIPARLSNQYALFLFSQRPHAFSSHPAEMISASIIPLAIVLEHAEFQKYATGTQRLALLGQLSRALVHEMNHHLSSINFTAHDIHHQLLEYLDNHEGFQPADVNELREIFGDLMLGIERLTNLSKTFSQITVQSQEQMIDPRSVLQDVLYLLRDTSDRAHIYLILDDTEDIPHIQINPLQLQQMVLNITLNAIQQIADLRPASGGRIHIKPEYLAKLEQLSIRVEDDGPGIHHQLWDHIYDLGFTTRKVGGSGLGLYITRSLAESLGGTIEVAESHMFWGTSFILKLPVRTM